MRVLMIAQRHSGRVRRGVNLLSFNGNSLHEMDLVTADHPLLNNVGEMISWRAAFMELRVPR